LQKPSILINVSLQNVPADAIKDHMSLSDWQSLQQKQYSACCVGVRIFLASDKENYRLTECQCTESALFAGRIEAQLYELSSLKESFLDLNKNILNSGIGFTIHKERPVQIAPLRTLVSPERAMHDYAGVRARLALKDL